MAKTKPTEEKPGDRLRHEIDDLLHDIDEVLQDTERKGGE